MSKELKQKIFNIIQIGDKSNLVSRCFDIFIVINILVNITVVFLDTFASMYKYHDTFRAVEIITTLFFCIEYLLRIWTADLLYPDKKGGSAVLKFLVSFDGIVDLLTIIPTFFLAGFVAFRMFRVVRIFHLFRLNAQYDSFNVITSVLYEKKNQIISSMFIVITLMLASSLTMYSVEHEAQPEVFKNAFSGLWWSMSTLLTIGYGDIYPITILGRIMAMFISFLGVGVVAIPTGIISAGFVEQYQKKTYVTNYKNHDIQDIIEIFIENELDGKTISQLDMEDGLSAIVILREGLTILPLDDTSVKAGDIVVAKNNKKDN